MRASVRDHAVGAEAFEVGVQVRVDEDCVVWLDVYVTAVGVTDACRLSVEVTWMGKTFTNLLPPLQTMRKAKILANGALLGRVTATYLDLKSVGLKVHILGDQNPAIVL